MRLKLEGNNVNGNKGRIMAIRLYPWAKWFSKGRFLIRFGEDYTCPNSSMAQQVRNAASKRGMEASIQDEMDHLVVTLSLRKCNEERRGGHQ